MTYGHLKQRFDVVLHRLGRDVAIHDRVEGGTDKFGNPTDSYPDSEEVVRCVRSYPSRNTEITNVSGDRNRDRPIFFFSVDDEPDDKARIVYPEDAETVAEATTTTTYELQAPTRYDTHVEIFGEVVTNEG